MTIPTSLARFFDECKCNERIFSSIFLPSYQVTRDLYSSRPTTKWAMHRITRRGQTSVGSARSPKCTTTSSARTTRWRPSPWWCPPARWRCRRIACRWPAIVRQRIPSIWVSSSSSSASNGGLVVSIFIILVGSNRWSQNIMREQTSTNPHCTRVIVYGPGP